MARISSVRPASSSPRVCRPIMNMLIRATRTSPIEPVWKATWPPIVSSAWTGPLKAMAPALSALEAAASSRSA
ncbi:hypothetical protein ACRJ4W_30200 [Streptomyces sp. GLT-R25]